jgi:hypothetical protein
MSEIVVSAFARQDPPSLQPGTTGGGDERANDIAISLPPSEAVLTMRFNVISVALSARRSIAISALALAHHAQGRVLQLLR